MKPIYLMLYAQLQACNFRRAAIGKEYYVPEVYVDFSKRGSETQLNEQFIDGEFQRILKGMNYRILELIFSFLACFIEHLVGGRRSTEEIQCAPF